MTKLATLFDVSLASLNLGDEIISYYVDMVLADCLSSYHVVRLPTHDSIGAAGRAILRNSELSIVGGTNLLSSHILKYQQWKSGPVNLFSSKNLTLMGVGWWQYQGRPDPITRAWYKSILGSKFLHSVRDQYTANKLIGMGVRNVLNTGCPTIWNLSPDHCARIPKRSGTRVVATVTDYNKDRVRDLSMLQVLSEVYDQVLVWPQGSGDLAYLNSLLETFSGKAPTYIAPSLAALRIELRKVGTDFVGTRLHAGIEALNQGCRTMIVGIDNRAIEMSRDFNLPVIPRNSDDLKRILAGSIETTVTLPVREISLWKAQFGNAME